MSQLIKISMQFFHLLVGPLVCWSIMLLLFGVLGATYALFITISWAKQLCHKVILIIYYPQDQKWAASVTALPREDRGDGPVTAREFWPGDFFPTPLKGMIPSSPMRICSYAVYLKESFLLPSWKSRRMKRSEAWSPTWGPLMQCSQSRPRSFKG